MTNRSSSAKWRKIDPYLQNAPMNTKMMIQGSKKMSKDEQPSTYTLPPIKKQSNSEAPSKSGNQKIYKPLGQAKLQKTSSNGLKDQISDRNIFLDENSDAGLKSKPPLKPAEVDYEKKNLERLQQIQARKAQELALMEEQRK